MTSLTFRRGDIFNFINSVSEIILRSYPDISKSIFKKIASEANLELVVWLNLLFFFHKRCGFKLDNLGEGVRGLNFSKISLRLPVPYVEFY